jgi:hypothetical protein
MITTLRQRLLANNTHIHVRPNTAEQQMMSMMLYRQTSTVPTVLLQVRQYFISDQSSFPERKLYA